MIMLIILLSMTCSLDSLTSLSGASKILLSAVDNMRRTIGNNSSDCVGSYGDGVGIRANDSFPFTTIAYAQTIDGSIAPSTKSRLNLSSKSSFQLLHSLRKYHDAVLVGINTIVIDDPRLNVRDTLPSVDIPPLQQQPRAVILDSNLKFLNISQLKVIRPIVVTTLPPSHDKFILAVERLNGIGGIVLQVKSSLGRCDIIDTFKSLKSIGVNSVLVEGGATILQSILESNLCHQVVITIRPCLFGGYRSLLSELPSPVQLNNIKLAVVEGDIVLLGSVIPPPLSLNSECSLLEHDKIVDFFRSEVDFVA